VAARVSVMRGSAMHVRAAALAPDSDAVNRV
jgi:hypothetical protein